MLRSNAVAKVNPCKDSNKSFILGIGKGALSNSLLSNLKSDTNLTVPSFFGITNVGAPHSDLFTFRKTPILTKRSTSSWNAFLHDFRIP